MPAPKCQGWTKQNRPCQNRTTDSSGYCWRHGPAGSPHTGLNIPAGEPEQDERAERAEQRAERAEQHAQQVEQQLRQARERAAQDENQLAELKAKVQTVQAELASAQNEVTRLRRAAADMVQQVETAEQRAQQAEQRAQQAGQQLRQARECAAKNDKELAELKAKVQTAQAELAVAQNEVECLRRAAADMVQQVETAEQRAQQAEQRAQQAEQRAQQAEQQLRQARECAAKDEKELAELKAKVQTAQAELAVAQNEVERLRRAAADMVQQVETAEQRAEQAELQLGQARECAAHNEQQLAELRAKVQALQDEVQHVHNAPAAAAPGAQGPTSTAPSATEKYWRLNLLDYEDTIGAVFYDPGRYRRGTERIQSLMQLRSMRMLDNRREVILVNYAEDRELQAFCAAVYASVFQLPSVRERAIKLAQMVATRLGGQSFSDQSFDDHLRCFESKVVSIGKLQLGMCRHRSVLFKAVADRLPAGCSVPARLVRGHYGDDSAGGGAHAWNVVRVREGHFVLDVMHDPGSLYPVDSEKANRYKRLGQIGGPPAGPGLESVLAGDRAGLLPFRIGRPVFGEVLGEGGFGVVHKAVLADGSLVAIKTIRADNVASDLNSFRKEMELWSTLRHPNIVRFRGYDDSEPAELQIALEFMAGGNLFRAIQQPDFMTEPVKRKLQLALQIASGLDYLHTREEAVVHADIKSLNILLDDAGVAKLTDFGLAERLSITDTSPEGRGYAPGCTWPWAAPEVLLHKRTSTKADVYSFAMVVWEIFTGYGNGRGLYGARINQKCMIEDAELVEAGQRRNALRPTISRNVPQRVRHLIEAAWLHSPQARPSMSEIVAYLTDLCQESEANLWLA